MKLLSPKSIAAILMLLLLSAIVPLGIAMEWKGQAGTVVKGWEQAWDESELHNVTGAAAIPDQNWIHITSGTAMPLPPGETEAAWLRFDLPETQGDSALLIDKIYGNHIKAYRNNTLIFDSEAMVGFSGSKVLIPLTGEEEGRLYLWSTGNGRELGIEGEVRLGGYNKLLAFYVKQDLVDLVIGAALVFMSAALLMCLFFLRVEFFSGGFWLVLVILSFGVLMITYSPFLPLITHKQDRIIEVCFDLALFTLLPAFTSYFERMFLNGRSRLLIRFRNFQLAYSLFCLCLMIANALLSYRLDTLYRMLTVNVLGIMMLLQFILLLSLAVKYAYKGSRDAVIFSLGFGVFAVVALTELLLFFASGERYQLYWWKWGVVVFIISLIVILGRRFARNYERTVEYSRELEKFNTDLQRSEKMEIISELAASVAHEVRNPLQVTRGFLQILGERSASKEQEYLKMAIDELDRASSIITDFLTFAKPGLDTVDVFEAGTELKHVAGILVPLANLQGGTIDLHLQNGLTVLGNPSKFKQAFINLIKNSIESLEDNGRITVTAWKSGEDIIISVKDNGEGMKASELARLGEPYYSNKTKGTGLGLMVTFRIIEAMDGTIKFQSTKGEGTEVTVKLPGAGRK
ncbi:sensor histidine kinase [Paenibacillus sp. PK3_47]|uniref:sensor histidine kinase n=1 Tax=Paenibacillus sp. PK3_47 TaxID=2072642 RepID=UPI00201E0872|nr:sensor histidine kinase [Paenibacillus sp. PK3_47]UQZ35031.1 sensor histidine kinase [Paenibacillus sp. PK3_47]